jgi:ribosomal protein S18 acetylase RimI-like enzyme
MEIRPYLETDEDAVIALWQRCNLVVPWNNPRSDIARKLAVDRDLFLVGLADGRVVASVMGGYEGHRGWVNYLAVDPVCRRKGYGRRIMSAVEERLKAKGCPKINLQVRASNREVIAFYEALGFSDDRVMGFGKRLVTDDPYDGRGAAS